MTKKKIAAIISEYRPKSHADVIVTKFLKGFPVDEGFFAPRVELASMYIDLFPDNDIGRQMAAEHDVPIYNSIPGALCLGGKEWRQRNRTRTNIVGLEVTKQLSNRIPESSRIRRISLCRLLQTFSHFRFRQVKDQVIGTQTRNIE